ncbi:MAG: ABC transporter ATP-binding protein [Bacillota bacterium]
MEEILQIKNLQISFFIKAGEVRAVRGITFNLKEKEVVAIVGESGCGKTVTALAMMGLIPNPPGRITGGSIIFGGEDITGMTEKEMQKIRGARIGMVFQDPMTSLNPTMTVGKQIEEGLMVHRHLRRGQARQQAEELLRMVNISNPEQRVRQYPHEFSGGMRQRVMIAMALSCSPRLLIADEPTTALDVTIQAQILDLMRELREKTGTSIILITHDLGIVAGLASRILVMYAGKLVEAGRVGDVFYQPRHPYTLALLRSVPRLDRGREGHLAAIAGQPPDLIHPPTGCAFAPRCDHIMRICLQEEPGAVRVAGEHEVSCWLNHKQAPSLAGGVSRDR